MVELSQMIQYFSFLLLKLGFSIADKLNQEISKDHTIICVFINKNTIKMKLRKGEYCKKLKTFEAFSHSRILAFSPHPL